MSSYAAAASKGPKQTPEEKRAPAPPEVVHTDSPSTSTSSLVDVDTASVHTVPSDFKDQPVKTDTQGKRIQRDAEQAEAKAKAEAEHVEKEFTEKEKKAKAQAKQTADKVEAKAKQTADQVEAKAKQTADQVEAKAKQTTDHLDANKDNPVFIGNAVAIVAISAGLGFGAYKKYAAGELTWKVVATWAGVVGLFAAGDYYLSQYLIKTKYPEKDSK